MPWSYSQTTGEMSLAGHKVGTAYSGNGEGLNNPAKQDVSNVGPLPQGHYSISQAFTHPSKGPVVMRLTALEGTETFGRAGFLIHGDNSKANHSASEGCIVAPRSLREQIAASTDRVLVVTG